MRIKRSYLFLGLAALMVIPSALAAEEERPGAPRWSEAGGRGRLPCMGRAERDRLFGGAERVARQLPAARRSFALAKSVVAAAHPAALPTAPNALRIAGKVIDPLPMPLMRFKFSYSPTPGVRGNELYFGNIEFCLARAAIAGKKRPPSATLFCRLVSAGENLPLGDPVGRLELPTEGNGERAKVGWQSLAEGMLARVQEVATDRGLTLDPTACDEMGRPVLDPRIGPWIEQYLRASVAHISALPNWVAQARGETPVPERILQRIARTYQPRQPHATLLKELRRATSRNLAAQWRLAQQLHDKEPGWSYPPLAQIARSKMVKDSNEKLTFAFSRRHSRDETTGSAQRRKLLARVAYPGHSPNLDIAVDLPRRSPKQALWQWLAALAPFWDTYPEETTAFAVDFLGYP